MNHTFGFLSMEEIKIGCRIFAIGTQELWEVGLLKVKTPGHLQHQWFGLDHETMKTIVLLCDEDVSIYEKNNHETVYINILSARTPVLRGNDLLPPVSTNRNEIVNDDNALCLWTQSSYGSTSSSRYLYTSSSK